MAEISTIEKLDRFANRILAATDEQRLTCCAELASLTFSRDAGVGAIIVGPEHSYIVTATRGEQMYNSNWEERRRPLHAEEVAISKAMTQGLDLQGATLYSSLEPCIQRDGLRGNGSTIEIDSCSERIRRSGISRVFYGASDATIKHASKHGADRLREAGIEVIKIPGLEELCHPQRVMKFENWLSDGEVEPLTPPQAQPLASPRRV